MDSNNYLSEARLRAKRRRSKWNLLLVPLTMIGVGLAWTGLAVIMAAIHSVFYPLQTFGQSRTNLGGCLLFVPLIFPSLLLGLMFSNVVIWCLPVARKTLDREAAGIPHASFQKSMMALAKLIIIVLPIALSLSLLGAIDPF